MSEDTALLSRIKDIVQVEKKIDELMKCTKDIVQELAKEKQISKNKMDESSATFRKLINQVETDLNQQMQYLGNVCVGSAHQGSTFGARQNSQLAQASCASLHNDLENVLNRVAVRGVEPDANVVVIPEEELTAPES